ncbi:MAG TPA: hypothetical protein VFR08_03430 [Candidatus Angelobacter sp.]|nr:hypothetical protein [Candidatus Angelobacter sp.]
MDFDKLKKDLEEKGIEKGKQELDKLKGRLGNFNSGQVNTTTQPDKGNEVHEGPPTDYNSGQMANSGQTGTTPVMDSGKADIREPEPPRRDEEIREPEPDDQEAAAAQRQESHREAAIEENPASDEGDKGEDAA